MISRTSESLRAEHDRIFSSGSAQEARVQQSDQINLGRKRMLRSGRLVPVLRLSIHRGLISTPSTAACFHQRVPLRLLARHQRGPPMHLPPISSRFRSGSFTWLGTPPPQPWPDQNFDFKLVYIRLIDPPVTVMAHLPHNFARASQPICLPLFFYIATEPSALSVTLFMRGNAGIGLYQCGIFPKKKIKITSC